MSIDSVLTLADKYGPTLMALVIYYFHNQAAKAKNDLRLSELELKIKANHEKVDKDNAGKSDSDIVDDITKG